MNRNKTTEVHPLAGHYDYDGTIKAENGRLFAYKGAVIRRDLSAPDVGPTHVAFTIRGVMNRKAFAALTALIPAEGAELEAEAVEA